jgi:hypothetical protein
MLPEEVAKQMSNRAVDIARVLAPKKTGKGALSLQPAGGSGEIGIFIPTSAMYMNYLDKGTEPRDMVELAGRTIPIRDASGNISFRTASASRIGKTVVTRDASGAITGSKIAWRHPGLKKQDFIGRALRQAVSEWCMSASSSEIIRMLDKTEAKKLVDLLRGIDY